MQFIVHPLLPMRFGRVGKLCVNVHSRMLPLRCWLLSCSTQVFRSAIHRLAWQVAGKSGELLLVTQGETETTKISLPLNGNGVCCANKWSSSFSWPPGSTAPDTREPNHGWQFPSSSAFQVSSIGLTQPPALLASGSLTAYKPGFTPSTNRTPPALAWLVLQGKSSWIWLFIFLLHSALGHSPLTKWRWRPVPFPEYQTPTRGDCTRDAGDASSI